VGGCVEEYHTSEGSCSSVVVIGRSPSSLWWYDGGVWYRCESRARLPPAHIVLLCTAVCLCVRARTHGLATWRAGPAWTHTHTHGDDVLESLGRWANSVAGPPTMPPWLWWRRAAGGGTRLLVMLGIRTADRADSTIGFSFSRRFSTDYSSDLPHRNGNVKFSYIFRRNRGFYRQPILRRATWTQWRCPGLTKLRGSIR